MNKEYERIKASGLTGNDLLSALKEFELKNKNHFYSKVDLGGFYLISGNIQLAANFFQRAEEISPKPWKNKQAREYITIMYGSLARIYLLQGDYLKAMDYVQKAIAADDEYGKPYNFLKAHILVAQDKQEEARTLFYELYQSQKDLMEADDVRAFMYLLAKAERYGDCAQMVDLYFEKGPFFAGLGLFASTVYENAGDVNKAILAAFLDYEYHSSYTQTNDNDFLANINAVERQLALKGLLQYAEPTIRLIRGLFNNSDLIFERNRNAFFVEDYCYFKKKILTSSLTSAEFEQYLQLERYFSIFPAYYWNLWQAALKLFPQTALVSFIPSLEKIIRLDSNGRYAKAAWEELTKLMGYTGE